MSYIDQFRDSLTGRPITPYKGRNARLFTEWDAVDRYCSQNPEVSYCIRKTNVEGLPVVYEVEYRICSFCGVAQRDVLGLERPLMADRFRMRIDVPNNYPNIDSNLEFNFLVKDAGGNPVPHPWHPNIRYFGDFAGRVCLSRDSMSSYTGLAWYIDRVARYLRYEAYHAKVGEPPFPEDDRVAVWVTEQGEPQGWVENVKLNNLQI